MGRRFLAVIAGVVTSFALVMLLEGVGHRLFVPGDVDISTMESARAAYQAGQIPTIAVLSVAVAYWIASFCGAFVASKLSKEQHQQAALIVGGLIVLVTIMNLIVLPHPFWFWIVGLLPLLPLAILGGRMGARMTGGAS